jgi:hypothetical protein
MCRSGERAMFILDVSSQGLGEGVSPFFFERVKDIHQHKVEEMLKQKFG